MDLNLKIGGPKTNSLLYYPLYLLLNSTNVDKGVYMQNMQNEL